MEICHAVEMSELLGYRLTLGCRSQRPGIAAAEWVPYCNLGLSLYQPHTPTSNEVSCRSSGAIRKMLATDIVSNILLFDSAKK
jgi:hypothetical protein